MGANEHKLSVIGTRNCFPR